MFIPFFLGLLGSLGHCVGMCSAVVVLINRQETFRNSKFAWGLAHLGRLTTYTILGLFVGTLGQMVGTALPSLPVFQGVLAMLLAGMALYFGLALLGRVPSPELLFGKMTQRWGRAMRRATTKTSPRASSRWTTPYLTGMLWGLLPCGLILTALLPAAAAADPWQGALRMAAFGLGTVPTLLGVRWLAQKNYARTWPRNAAAVVMILFSMQFTLRGLAAWGLVNHMMLGKVMLW